MNKTSEIEFDSTPVVMQIVYDLGGIKYVPHYRKPGVFVGPGYYRDNMLEYSARYLEVAGAKSNLYPLWERLCS